jgi:DNA repair protein RadC
MKHLSNLELLAMLVGEETAKTLAARPLTEVFGFSKPKTTSLMEEPKTYEIHPNLAAAKELMARCFEERMRQEKIILSSIEAAIAFACLRIGHLENEAFWCLWLNSQNHLILAEEMFRGAINWVQISVREVVKRALEVNAASVIFAHNHPSGVTNPSIADEGITNRLKQALALVEITVLDHIVVAGKEATSFARSGLI